MVARDFNLIAPLAPEVVMLASIFSKLVEPSVVKATGPTAVMAADKVSDEPVEMADTPPADEVKVEPLLVIAPEPESAMFPTARKLPVGPTVVPPLMVSVPAEFIVPEPV
jgi:hypothetical protein